MLYGKFVTSVDDKGRAGIGQQFREQFGEVAKAYQTASCLRVYTDGGFENEFKQALAGLDSVTSGSRLLESDASRARRKLFGNVFDVNFDKQGRMTIPKSVRKDLALIEDSAVVWIGVDDYIELWPSERLYEEEQFEKELEKRKRRYLMEQAELHQARLDAQWNYPASPDTDNAGCAWPGRVPEKPAQDPSSTQDPGSGHGDGRK